MEKNWICIYKTPEVHLAQIAKDLLFDKEIDAVVINKQDSNYQFGLLELYVERDNAVKAKHIIKNVES